MDFVSYLEDPTQQGNSVELQGGGKSPLEAWDFILQANPKLARVGPHWSSSGAGTGMEKPDGCIRPRLGFAREVPRGARECEPVTETWREVILMVTVIIINLLQSQQFIQCLICIGLLLCTRMDMCVDCLCCLLKLFLTFHGSQDGFCTYKIVPHLSPFPKFVLFFFL